MTERPQHLTALAKANRVRLAQAALHRRVTPGPRTRSWTELADILDERHDCLGNLTIGKVLRWGHRMSHTNVRRIMGHAGVRDENRTLRELTSRQLAEITHDLREPREITVWWTGNRRRPRRRPVLEAKPLGAAVWRAALDGGHSPVDVCDRVGVSRSTVAGWTNGRIRNVKPETADRVLLGLDLHWWDVWPDNPDAEQLFEAPKAAA